MHFLTTYCAKVVVLLLVIHCLLWLPLFAGVLFSYCNAVLSVFYLLLVLQSTTCNWK